MRGDLEVLSTGDCPYRPLQGAIGEGRQAPASSANQVMMVLVRVDPLEAGGVPADVDPLNEMELLQLVQGPVDACAAH